MAVTAKFKKEQYSKFLRGLRESAALVGDLRIPLTEIGKRFLESRKFIFDMTRSGPGKYKDLSPKYKRRKERLIGQAYPILFLSGALKKSITERGGQNIFKVRQKTLTIGTRVPYAPYHQSKAPRTKIPRREFLFWGPESSKFANHRVVKKQNRHMADTLFIYIERRLGKELGAAITSARRKTRDIFA